VVDAELRVIIELAPEPAGSWPVLRVAGEIDIQTSPILEEHLQRALDLGKNSIVVDLNEVTFLDSTGLSVLVAGFKRCQGAGGDMRIERPQPNVLRVFEITGLADAFHVKVPEEGGTSD
jgi:anti-sigma B factor antagonist